MDDAEYEERVTTVPTLGAKVCMLLAALALVAAGYHLLAPVQVSVQGGSTFFCGTAVSGPDSKFGKGLCGRANDIARARGVAWLVGALVLGAGGFLVFGTSKKRQLVRPRESDEGDDDEAGETALTHGASNTGGRLS